MKAFVSDIKYSTRQLIKSPGFTAVAVISLALGIGANTAIFSLVNAVLLRSLPVPNPQELRVIQWSGHEPKTGWFSGSLRPLGGDTGNSSGWFRVGDSIGRRMIADAFTYPQFRALGEQCAAQADLVGYVETRDLAVRGRGDPFVARGIIVSGNFFPGLGVRPVLGRLLTAEDDQPGAAPVIVLSYGWWERHFGLDPGVLGRTVLLNGDSHTVVGVLPRGFTGVSLKDEGNEFYVPMSAQPRLVPEFSQTAPDHWWIQLLARLKPGVSDARFQAVLDAAFTGQAGSVMKAPRIELSPGRAGVSHDREFYRRPLLILLGAVGTVLLVACANLAGLSLARGTARQHELAVRAALGAGRGRLIRQSLTESLVLALSGGLLGILLAVWGKAVLSRLLAGSPEGLRYDLPLDRTVLGFTLIVALVTGLLSGLLPAVRAGRADPLCGLKDRATLSSPRLRAGRILVAAQVSLSLLLLVGAGLYIRTLTNLVKINPGFATDDVLLFKLEPTSAGLEGQAVTSFYEQVQESLAAIPGVRSATLVHVKLLGGWMSGGSFFKLPSHPELNEKRPQAHRLTVGDTFFATMGIPILMGRGFAASDTDAAAKVVVVNETFLREYLTNEHPIGQVLHVGALKGVPIPWQIIGVCRDAKYTGIKTDVPPTVYFSFRQDRVGASYVALRTVVQPLSLVGAARKVVASVNPNVPLSDVTTQAAVRDRGISQETMFATLCGGLAALAVLLSCIGLYGLMAYNVARRTGEIGIRMALGAGPRDVVRPILGEALLLALTGVAVGLPVALLTGRLINSQLYGVASYDPLTLAAVVAALVVVALMAAWLPARRAARIDPMVALRHE